jgi:hypothetical protein
MQMWAPSAFSILSGVTRRFSTKLVRISRVGWTVWVLREVAVAAALANGYEIYLASVHGDYMYYQAIGYSCFCCF